MRARLALAARAMWVALLGVACAAGQAERAGPAARAGTGGPIVCPHDAVVGRGAGARGCECAPGLSLLEGACVGPRELEAYCGAPIQGLPRTAACPTPACAAGDPIDLPSGVCVPARVARAIVARARPIPSDLALACREGQVLVVHGDDVSCLPMADVCPRTTAWDQATTRCAAIPPCSPGEIRGERECERVIAGGPGGTAVVDVGRWGRTMIGAAGGEGASRLCQPFAGRPWELDVGPGGARTLALSIELRFPDNDVTQASGTVEVTDAASGLRAQPGQGAQKALDSLLVPLRALGGLSDAASATLQVRCTARGGSTPRLVPSPAP